MKKFTKWLILGLVLSAMMAISVSAADTFRYALSADNSSVEAGDTVTVTISAAENPGLLVTIFNVNYDANVFDVQSKSVGTVMPDNASRPVEMDQNAGVVKFSLGNNLSTTDYKDTGVLATVTFKVKDNAALGDTVISTEYEEGNTLNSAMSSVLCENASLKVTIVEQAIVPEVVPSTDPFEEVRKEISDPEDTSIAYQVTSGSNVKDSEQEEIFSGIQDTDKVITFSFPGSGNYSWSFSGANIDEPSVRISDFNIIVGETNTNAIAAAREQWDNALNVRFVHEGSLPGTAYIRIPVIGYEDGTELDLYWYNPNPGEEELMLEVSGIVVTGGYVAFPLEHCSNYILTAQTLRNLLPEDDGEEAEVAEEVQETEQVVVAARSSNVTTTNRTYTLDLPRTGDTRPVWFLSGIAGVSLLGLIGGSIIRRKKARKTVNE